MPKMLGTWQIWSGLKGTLTESFLMQVMGKKNARTIRLYSQDPRTSEDRCKDPLEALHIIFSEADLLGRGDLARKAIGYLQTALDDSEEVKAPKALLPTLDAEKLADFQSVAAFQRGIDEGLDADLIEVLLLEAKEELDRTFAKHLQG